MQAADPSRRRAAAARGNDRLGTGMAASLAAHALLVAALVWGVSWNTRTPEGVAVELWSATPRIAAQGREPTAAPAPRPRPTPPTPPTPSPAPAPTPAPRPAPAPPPRPAEIADRKDVRKEPPKPNAADVAKARREQAAKEQAAKEQAEREQAEADKKAEAAKQADAKKKAEADKKAQTARENAAREQARKDQLARINAQLGGEPGGSPSGQAPRSSGPSAGYAGRIKARIRPNIVFTDSLSGNPAAEVEVRVAPDGTIIGQRLTKSSGVPAWDAAVLRAVERTAILPRDTDGRVPPVMLLTFRPQD